MTSPLRLTDPGTSPDSIDAWLNVLAALMRGPRDEVDAVREELASHLRERVRDLMLSGASEADATSRAIAELGDAASLARRFQDAIVPSQRRSRMQIAVLTVSVAAAAFGGATLLGPAAPNTPDPSRTAVRSLVTAAGVSALACPPERGSGPVAIELAVVPSLRALPLADTPATLMPHALFTPPEDDALSIASGIQTTPEPTVTVGQLIKLLESGGQPVAVRWDLLEQSGVSRDQHFASPGGPCSAADLLAALNASQEHGDLLGLRLRNGTLVLATNEYFDRQETGLITFDLSPVIEHRRAASIKEVDPAEIVTEAKGLVESLVFPDTWANNGGDRASSREFGARVFFEAPARYRPKIKWVLDQLLSDASPATTMITTRDVPILAGLPLLETQFRPSVSERLIGTATIRSSPEGKVSVQQGDRTIVADEIRLEAGEPTPK
ncbi:MAG: permease prefix domain 1-containing protein [Phycisphaerales bacterium]